MSYTPLTNIILDGDPRSVTPGAGDNDTSIATTAFVQTELTNYLALAGGTMVGDITLDSGVNLDLAADSQLSWDGGNANLFYDSVDQVIISDQRIRSASAPLTDADLANKGYVDSVAMGLDVKASVRVATQENIDLSAPGALIDGAALVSGDRVLVKAQDNAVENGIYVYDTDSTPMVRSEDADTAAEVTPGMFTFVESGTNADEGWVLTSDDFQFGIDGLSFTQFSNAVIISTLDSLTDVDVAGAVEGSVLYFDGSGWVDSQNTLIHGSGHIETTGQISAGSFWTAGNITSQGGNIQTGLGGGIFASGDMSAGGMLNVTGDAAFAADASVGGDLTVTGDVSAVNATLSGNMSAVNATLSGDMSATNANLSGDVSAVNATLSGDIEANNATLSGTLSANDIDAGGNLHVASDTTMDGGLSVAGSAAIGGDIEATNALLSGDMSAVNATLSGNLDVEGDVNATGNVNGADFNGQNGIFSADLSADGDLSVTGAANIGGAVTGASFSTEGNLSAGVSDLASLHVFGETQLDDNLIVAGSASVTGDISSNAGIQAEGNMETYGDLITHQSLYADDSLYVGGDQMRIHENGSNEMEVVADLRVTGALSTNDGLTVASGMTIQAGGANIADGLDVTSGDLTVDSGAIYAPNMYADDSLYVGGDQLRLHENNDGEMEAVADFRAANLKTAGNAVAHGSLLVGADELEITEDGDGRMAINSNLRINANTVSESHIQLHDGARFEAYNGVIDDAWTYRGELTHNRVQFDGVDYQAMLKFWDDNSMGELEAQADMFKVSGSIRFSRVNHYDASTELSNSNEHIVLVDTTGGAVTMTLPASPLHGMILQIKDAGGNAEAEPITIDANGKTIDGDASAVMGVNFQSATVIYDSAADAWFFI